VTSLALVDAVKVTDVVVLCPAPTSPSSDDGSQATVGFASDGGE
jgi:hypothetical protein